MKCVECNHIHERRSQWCSRECKNKWYYKHNVEYYRSKKLTRLFGLTAEDYDTMLENQGGVCAICQSPPKNNRLAVDHDHNTGEIRGLLCTRCNVTLETFLLNQSAILKYVE